MCGTVFDVTAKKEEILKLEQETLAPEFWKDHARASRVSARIAALKEEVDVWGVLMSKIEELRELVVMVGEDASMAAELEKKVGDTEHRFQKAETQVFFSGKYDAGDALLSIYAGAGGEDAEDWAGILLRMYEKYIARRGWEEVVLHRHENEKGGIKNATLEVRGAYAFGYLKGEKGVHRLVRISPFDANKRRHTSFALVEILPVIEDEGEIELKPDDVEYDFTRSSGPGGQNVNKRETAVRVVHKPTGLAVEIQTERSQAQNKEQALKLLRARLYQLREKSKKKEMEEIKGGKVAIEWGSQIRSYVFHPYQMVKDHRTGVETSQVDKVLEGGLDEFIEAELRLEAK